MKYYLSICILLFQLFAVATYGKETPAEKWVKALSERKNSWLTTPQTDSLKNLLDNRCQYIHSNGWKQTATQVVEDINSKKLVYKKITITESTARQYEKMVIVTGSGKFDGTLNGNDFSLDLAFTEVYVNRAGGWKLVSRHSSKIVL